MPARRQIKAGERIGRWTALKDGDYTLGRQVVDCRCDCGTERAVSAGNLRSRKSPSCGCARADGVAAKCRRPVKAGERFGRLTATRESEYGGARCAVVPCVCDCGEQCNILQKCLRRGTTKSCGCLHRERSSQAATRDIGSRANLNRLYEGVRGAVWMRSSWEVAVAKRFDRDGLSWEYEPETFRLDEHTRYTPDFKVDLGPLGDLWVEVKGEFFGRSEHKVASFRATGRSLYLVGRDNFKQYSGISPYIANKRYPPRSRAV
jgi:hypothetical protein